MKSFNLQSYLAKAEDQFSAFDGEDIDFDADADDLYFDDYEEDYDEEYYGADGAANAAAKTPSPYQLTIVNSTAGTLNAVLFGMNKYLLSTNFGSPATVTVTPSQTNVSYLELLQQSAAQPFETSLIRVQSSSSTQITQIMSVTVKDANGQELTLPIITQSYFSAYQQQSGILDIAKKIKVDGSTYITYPVEASTTVTVTFFPSEKVSISKGLSGQKAVQNYSNPQVNLGGMSFPKKKRPARGGVHKAIARRRR